MHVAIGFASRSVCGGGRGSLVISPSAAQHRSPAVLTCSSLVFRVSSGHRALLEAGVAPTGPVCAVPSGRKH